MGMNGRWAKLKESWRYSANEARKMELSGTEDEDRNCTRLWKVDERDAHSLLHM